MLASLITTLHFSVSALSNTASSVMTADVSRVSYRPQLMLLMAAAVVLVVLALLPLHVGLYQTQLLTYGLIAAIAALGFNLLLGYTGLLSFGHSASLNRIE